MQKTAAARSLTQLIRSAQASATSPACPPCRGRQCQCPPQRSPTASSSADQFARTRSAPWKFRAGNSGCSLRYSVWKQSSIASRSCAFSASVSRSITPRGSATDQEYATDFAAARSCSATNHNARAAVPTATYRIRVSWRARACRARFSSAGQFAGGMLALSRNTLCGSQVRLISVSRENVSCP